LRSIQEARHTRHDFGTVRKLAIDKVGGKPFCHVRSTLEIVTPRPDEMALPMMAGSPRSMWSHSEASDRAVVPKERAELRADAFQIRQSPAR